MEFTKLIEIVKKDLDTMARRGSTRHDRFNRMWGMYRMWKQLGAYDKTNEQEYIDELLDLLDTYD